MKKHSLYFLICLLPLGACKKFVTVPAPVTQLDGASAYQSNASATSVLTGLYSQMSSNSNSFGGTGGFSAVTGLSADEFTATISVGPVSQLAYADRLQATQFSNIGFWTTLYGFIYVSNAAIEGLNGTDKVTAAVKKELLGEAQFSRACFYFYLVNLYGDVPLITSTNYQQNAVAARTPQAQVWAQIYSDLNAALGNLNDHYVGSDGVTASTERTRPDKAAAAALLARVNLYQQKWADAEAQATAVISSGDYQLTALDNVFLANSPEAIWQLQPVIPGQNTLDGTGFILNSAPNFANPGYLSDILINKFEPGDQRTLHWLGSVTDPGDGNTYRFPFKYKQKDNPVVSEYQMVFRLAEQYLIRAEARAMQGNISGAQADLNAVRARAGLGPTPATDQASLLTAIAHERETELFTEGDRWFNLKRTGTVDAVMTAVAPSKNTTWNPNYALYPIPLETAINRDPNLKQNPGY